MKVGENLKKIILFMVMLFPVLLLFGTHVVFFKISGVGYVTLPRVYGWLLIILTAAFFIAKKRVEIPLGRSFWFAAFFVLMLLYALVSLIWVIDRRESLGAFMYQLSGVGVAVFMAAVIQNFNNIKLFLRILSVCYIVIVMFSIIEIYSGVYFFHPGELAYTLKDSYGLNFPYTVFYNTNDNAAFLTMFAPFVVFTIIDWVGGKLGKLIGIVLSVMAFFALICGRARNCFTTIICFMAVLLLICVIKKNLRKYAVTVAAICASLPFSALIIKLTELKSSSVLNKIGTINGSDHSISERLEMTLGGFRMAAAYHFMGVGVGNSVPLMPYFSRLKPINLHDMPLQIFVEYGIIIFVLYALVTIFLARDFTKSNTNSDKERLFVLLCFLTLLAFQVVGLQPSDAMHILALWMLFGIWLSAVKILYKDDDVQPRWLGRCFKFINNNIKE